MDWLKQNTSSIVYSTAGIWSVLIAFFIAIVFGIHETSPWAWLILVLGIDVSHVYSTLYRTYFNSKQRKRLSRVLILVPLFCLAFALCLAFYDIKIFWSFLAYTAIFHFSRQQIGFFRWLKKEELQKGFQWSANLSTMTEVALYLSTLGSVLLWHFQGPKNFNWFIKNDLFYIPMTTFTENIYTFFFYGILLINAVIFIFLCYQFYKGQKNIFIPLLILSTWCSWFIPIVISNSDFIFTAANVLAHGIPYLYLVYTEEKRTSGSFKALELFLPLLLLFSFLEESLWDSFIWREHGDFFESLYFLPSVKDHPFGLAFITAVLILPQLTHYVLDGFIWKKENLEPA